MRLYDGPEADSSLCRINVPSTHDVALSKIYHNLVVLTLEEETTRSCTSCVARINFSNSFYIHLAIFPPNLVKIENSID